MNTEYLKDIKLEQVVGNNSLRIGFGEIRKDFTDTDRYIILYSNVEYDTENFHYSALLPTVKIPYEDESTGFIIRGSLMSSTGIYQRAPGAILDVDAKGSKVDIISTRNSKTTLRHYKNGIVITFRRNGMETNIPMGVFLKAFSEMPYGMILNKIYYRPASLLNSFVSEIVPGSANMLRVPCYQCDGDAEPSVEDCINKVYTAIAAQTVGGKNSNFVAQYSSQWKRNRIVSYLNNLHFKSVEQYENTLSVASRARGLQVASNQKLCEYFDESGNVQDISVKKGDFVDSALEESLRKYDIDKLAVMRDGKRLVLQECMPMVFRIKGYRLAEGVPELDLSPGAYVDDDVLDILNKSSINYLEVETPNGRKAVYRSGEEVTLGDFITLINFLFTGKVDSGAVYETANRIILSYSKQVQAEVNQVYSDICDAIMGCEKLGTLVDSLPRLPIDRLTAALRDPERKDIGSSEITNVLAVAIANNRSSALVTEAPKEMTMVQKGQFGRIDSLHVPESEKVGSVNQLTVMGHINSATSEIQTPYEIVRDGKLTGEIVQVTAAQEKDKYIVQWNEDLTTDTVKARINGDVTTVRRKDVSYRDPSPFSDMSVSRATCPFPEFSQPKRAIMASKMGGQAVPLIYPERAVVSTGADTMVPCMYYTTRDIIRSVGVDEVDGGVLRIVSTQWGFTVTYKMSYGGKSFDYCVPFMATSKCSLYNYNLNVKPEFTYGIDDIVLYNQSCDIGVYEFWQRVDQGVLPYFKDCRRPGLALGVNLRVCYKTFESTTIDDAVTISDELISNCKLTSIQIMRYEYEVRNNETLREDAVPKLHAFLQSGDSVIRFYRGAGTAQKVYCKYAVQSGEVIHVQKSGEGGKVAVWVATYHNAEVGDKVAGRFGNKSVIARILPKEMMPYDPDTGDSMQIICSPLGVPSRMNYGQVLEISLGAAMRAQGKLAVVTPFYKDVLGEVSSEYRGAGLIPKRLFNPKTGRLTERPVMTGVLYFLKLEQMANLKWSAVGAPTSVDAVFGQSVNSLNSKKGQSIAEMESWALLASGANKQLNTYYTFGADGVDTRKKYFRMLNESAVEGDKHETWDDTFGPIMKYDDDNMSALVLQVVFRTSGLDIEVREDNRYHIIPLDLDDISEVVTLETLKAHTEMAGPREWTKIALKAPSINPFWVENFPLNVVLGVQSVKTIINQTAYVRLEDLVVVPRSEVNEYNKKEFITGVEGLLYLLDNTSIETCINRMKSAEKLDDEGSAEFHVIDDNWIDDDLAMDLMGASIENGNVISFLHHLRDEGKTLSELKMIYLPVLPGVFRQPDGVGGRDRENEFQNHTIRIAEAGTPTEVYKAMKSYIGYGTGTPGDKSNVRRYFFGWGAPNGEHGRVRERIMSKRVAFSGRTVISPMADMTVSPFFVGLPWRVVLKEMEQVISLRLLQRSRRMGDELAERTRVKSGRVESLTVQQWISVVNSLYEYQPNVLGEAFGLNGWSGDADVDGDLKEVYYYLRKEVRGIVEGNVRDDGAIIIDGEWRYPETLDESQPIDAFVVLFGRQPTLHRKSLRTFFVKLVDGLVSRIHPVTCASYNADFDGDAMYNCQLIGESKVESFKTTSILQDLISERDGSYTLSLSQDVALGLYCLTTYKDNAETVQAGVGQYRFYDSVEMLRLSWEYGSLNAYDVVLLLREGHYYLSTAGRIMVNACLPNGFTNLPFVDKDGVFERVFGVAYDGDRREELRQLKCDAIWTATGAKGKGREDTVLISNIMLDIYYGFGPRESIMTTQRLYEMGLVASDHQGVSISLDDLYVDCDVKDNFVQPEKDVRELNSLYQWGLISKEDRKRSSARIWDDVKSRTKVELLEHLSPMSNLYYMMMSGARGSQDQIMQTLGFIGNISKTEDEDIEMPILASYGHGLSAYDMMQTRPSARLGVVAAQSKTKETGYATRQSVYMLSGLEVKEDDCGIRSNVVEVEYAVSGVRERRDELLGEFIVSVPEAGDVLRPMLARTNGMITDEVIDLIEDSGIREIETLEGVQRFRHGISVGCRDKLLSMYSYALPYTVDGAITEDTLQWIESFGLKEVVAVEQGAYDGETYPENAVFMPVHYDSDARTYYLNGEVVDEEVLLGVKVAKDSKDIIYYERLLKEGATMTIKALNYIAQRKIRDIRLANGDSVKIRYKITDIWRGLCINRMGYGLPYLNSKHAVTKETLDEVEKAQMGMVAVRSGITCLTEGGYCAHCYGLDPYSGEFPKIGANLGITAAQTMCEPLSQATLNVQNSGGNRTGLVSGMKYYQHLLKGRMVSQRNEYMLESYATVEGYVKQSKFNPAVYNIVDKDGNEVQSGTAFDASRLAVPDGAYVDVGDTIVSGLSRLDRYDSKEADLIRAVVEARSLLIEEYGKVLFTLKIGPRNYEVLARAQTSNCYLKVNEPLPRFVDTSQEFRRVSGNYYFRLSNQAETIMKYSGIAAVGFERAPEIMSMMALTPEGVSLGSGLGNIISGTPIGSVKAKCIPRKAKGSVINRQSNNAKIEAKLRDYVHSRKSSVSEGWTKSDMMALPSSAAVDELFAILDSAENGTDGALLDEGAFEVMDAKDVGGAGGIGDVRGIVGAGDSSGDGPGNNMRDSLGDFDIGLDIVDANDVDDFERNGIDWELSEMSGYDASGQEGYEGQDGYRGREKRENTDAEGSGDGSENEDIFELSF